MKKLIGNAGFLFLLLVFTGCGTTAMVQKDNHVDLRKYGTYNWVKASTKDTNQVGNNNNDLQDRKIKESIDQNMMAVGWKLVNKKPDVLLTYDIEVQKENQNVRTPVYSSGGYRYVYNMYGRWIPVYYPSQIMGYRNSNQMVQELTLTVSLIDTESDKTIWQGWTVVDNKNRRLSDQEIEKNVKAIIKKLE